MSDIEQIVLTALSETGVIEDSWDFAKSKGIDHQALVGVQKSLLGDAYTKEESLSTTIWSLTSEGEKFTSVRCSNSETQELPVASTYR